MSLCPLTSVFLPSAAAEASSHQQPIKGSRALTFSTGLPHGSPRSQEEHLTLRDCIVKTALLKSSSSQFNYLPAPVITCCEIFFVQDPGSIPSSKYCQSVTFMAVATTTYDASIDGWGSLGPLLLQSRELEQRYLALDPVLLDFSASL